jgi:hypothetical protein
LFTNDVDATFKGVQAVIENKQLSDPMKAAYRDGEEFRDSLATGSQGIQDRIGNKRLFANC